jgi:hypothetical protein
MVSTVVSPKNLVLFLVLLNILLATEEKEDPDPDL